MSEDSVEYRTADAMIAEVVSEFSRKTPEERAFIVFRGFFDAAERRSEQGRELSDGLLEGFYEWLDDPRNRAAKETALDRMIMIEQERLREYGYPVDERNTAHTGRLEQIITGSNPTRL